MLPAKLLPKREAQEQAGNTGTAEGSVQARTAMAEVSEEGPADSGENASQAAEHGNKAADKMQDGIMITVPDDTVFDQVGSDGTYVSSSLYYKSGFRRRSGPSRETVISGTSWFRNGGVFWSGDTGSSRSFLQ